jgi:small subunit ribosomal protein S6
MHTYEAMFLLGPNQPTSDAAFEPIQAVLGRFDADILGIKLWDERRLAYEVQGYKRGTYILTYFKMDPTKITELEHECQLSEAILRVLFLRRDEVTEKELEADTPATMSIAPTEDAPAKDAAPAADAAPVTDAAAPAEAPAEEAVVAEVVAEAPAEEPAAEVVAEAPVEAPAAEVVAEAPAEAPAAEVAAVEEPTTPAAE